LCVCVSVKISPTATVQDFNIMCDTRAISFLTSNTLKMDLGSISPQAQNSQRQICSSKYRVSYVSGGSLVVAV
jgi:hypothetical protein